VRDTAVSRYHNRLPPGTNMATSDHRLETVVVGDRRAGLRAAVPRIPATAPVYIVPCVTDTANNGWGLIEAAFAAFQYLVQARILGLGGCLTAPLTLDERAAVRTALGLSANEQPVIVFSTGSVLTGVNEHVRGRSAWVRARPGLPVRIEYELARPSSVGFQVLDLAGRALAEWSVNAAAPGPGSTEWRGTDRSGNPVPAGLYILQVTAGKETERCRILLVR
jgi:hypothetical protein